MVFIDEFQMTSIKGTDCQNSSVLSIPIFDKSPQSSNTGSPQSSNHQLSPIRLPTSSPLCQSSVSFMEPTKQPIIFRNSPLSSSTVRFNTSASRQVTTSTLPSNSSTSLSVSSTNENYILNDSTSKTPYDTPLKVIY